MADTVIRVDGIGKRYRISHQSKSYGRLTESLSGLVMAPFDRMRGRSHQSSEWFWALKDVSFEVSRGDVVGVVGRNGAGKSTLLKVLSRITEPTTGMASMDGRVASLLEVGTGFHPELSGRENIYLSGSILGMTQGGDGPTFRRDRGLRRGGTVPRHAGEALLERDERAIGVRGSCPPCNGNPDRGRSTGSGRRGFPEEVPV